MCTFPPGIGFGVIARALVCKLGASNFPTLQTEKSVGAELL